MGFSLRQVLTVVVAVIAILMYSNVKNCRVYEMSQTECILLQSSANIALSIFKLINKITDAVYSNPSNYVFYQHISKEYRAFKQVLSSFDYIRPTDANTDQVTFLNEFNKTDNMLQYIVPIPKSTKISSQYINIDPVTIEKEIKIKMRSSSSNTDYSKFYPQNTRVIWLIGDENVQNSSNSRTIIFIHGGSYTFGGPSHIGFASELSIATQTRIAYICYDVAPKVSIPYQVDQVLTVYFYLTLIMKIPSERIIISGDSAGGGLSLLSIQKLGSNNLQHLYPNGVAVISPWVDLALNAESYKTNEETDIIIHVDALKRCGHIAANNDERNFKNGFYSALYGSPLVELPRMYFVVSKHETLYDDSQQLVAKFKSDSNGKIDLRYDVEEDMPHDWLLFVDVFPEADKSFAKLVQIMLDWLIFVDVFPEV